MFIELGSSNVFELLHPRLRAVIHKYNYKYPTPVQEKAIPLVLNGYNVLVVAPTGSGKTEAALFPIFSNLVDINEEGIKAIYVTPLRSLNRDIFNRMAHIANDVGLRLEVRHGDSAPSEKKSFLRDPPDIMVTTPETLYFLLSVEKFRKMISHLRFIVVDEIHELFSSKRGAEFSLALERIDAMYTVNRLQIIGLSATVKDPYEFGRRLMSWRYFIVVEVNLRKELDIIVDVIDSESSRANKILEYVNKSKGPVIVFTNTRDTAELVSFELRELLGEKLVSVHHGSLSVNVRLDVESRLKKGLIRAVVATSSLELGIDIGFVESVIQYMSPRQAIKLVQRAGRSGHRLGAKSFAIVVSNRNLFDVLESAVLAARAMRGNLEDLPFDELSYDALIHQMAGIVLEKKSISVHRLYNLVTRSKYYEKLDIGDIDAAISIAESVGILNRRNDTVKLGPRLMSYYFSTTMIPDTRQYKVIDIESSTRIGVLDEEFVVTLEPGDVFVLSGELWEVISVDDDGLVRVRRYKGRKAVLPYWEGDLIPVEKEVAREVASILRRLDTNTSVLNYYPLSNSAREYIIRKVNDHKSRGLLVPHDKRIVIEYYGDMFVTYSFLGSRGNKALEFLLAGYIEEVQGIPPRTASNPYIVAVKLAKHVDAKFLENCLRRLSMMNKHEIMSIIEKAAKRSRLYQWILLRVAQRSGAVPRNKSSVTSIRAVLRGLADTVLGVEALREMKRRKIDVNAVMQFLKRVRDNKVEIVTVRLNELSPLTMEALGETRFGERLPVERLPIPLLMEIVKRRLSKREVRLVCMHCGYLMTRVLGALEDYPTCTNCGSRMLAPVYSNEEASMARRLVKARLKHQRLSRSEQEVNKELYERASLVAEYGKKAIEALYSKGVGIQTAKQVLRKLLFGEEAFYKALVEAEARYHVYKHKLKQKSR